MRELLIEKGILTADEVRRQVEDMDKRTPLQGAKVVARAWIDPNFRKLLLSDGNAACEALGLEGGPYKLVVVENTAQVHNVIVCTLCSCYPRWLLGLPPDWYKSRNYRSRVINEPREVLKEFGTTIAGRYDRARPRFQRRHALSGTAEASGGHRGLARGETRCAGDPRLHGRCRLRTESLTTARILFNTP